MKVVPVVLLYFLIDVAVSQKRLYYTGQFKNDEVKNVDFTGSRLHLSDLFQYTSIKHDWIPDFNNSFLYSGQTLLRLKHVNISVEEGLMSCVMSELQNLTEISVLSAAHFKQISSYQYGLGDDEDDDGVHLEVEIGLYDHAQDVFIERYWREISGGDLIAVTAETTTLTNDEDESIIIKHRHRLLFSRDYLGRYSVLMHTWTDDDDNQSNKVERTIKTSATLRVMTYNLWHNNPPSWIYHDKRARWNRYEQRLRHFADVVVSEDPDVITLQEVRHDSAFSTPSKFTRHWNDENSTREDAGSQVEHLLSHLAMARQRRQTELRNGEHSNAKNNDRSNDDSSSGDGDDGNYYQFVFHPAMAMLERTRLVYRNEEGLLILSKYPIVDSDVFLLPRQIGDSSDDHQRIILRAKIKVPSNNEEAASTVVDVMTTHLSLSETARDRAALEIIRLTSCYDTFKMSPLQILTGDFNAEPDENFIRVLLNAESYAAPQCRADSEINAQNLDEGVISVAPFVDSWLQHFHRQNSSTSGGVSNDGEKHGEEVAAVDTEFDVSGNLIQSTQAKSLMNKQQEIIDNGFTFPSCNPVKRIDFILARNGTRSDAATSLRVEKSYVTGQRPTAETEHLVGSREGLGMNDRDSPIWASDHFAVVTDFSILF